MAFTRSETVAKIIEEFGELRKKDPTISIKEIAEMYGVDKTTIYHVLDEIAEKNDAPAEQDYPLKKKSIDYIIEQNGLFETAISNILSPIVDNENKCIIMKLQKLT